MKLASERLTVDRWPSGERITAETNVVIDSGTNHITCDRAVYAYTVQNGVTNGTLTTTGHVMITGDPDASKGAAGSADPRLEKKVVYSTKQASVQDIVRSLAELVGLKYNWQKSFDQTDPLCRKWVWNVTIDGKTCQQALEQILKPVGLRYQVEDGVLVLSRQDEGSGPDAEQHSGK
ncbi:MAG TPA: STN domain-containing protein [Verrucomicrobiae bacterium]|nr:STN domain-containing protein [Verrucomicrobiae bacterium]